MSKRIHYKIWLVVYLLGELMCRSIQYEIRPHAQHNPAWVVYLLGVAPNFFGAISAPSIIVFLLHFYDLKKHGRIGDLDDYLKKAVLISVSGIVMWEAAQPLTGKYYFDPQDILWTFIGAGVFIALALTLKRHFPLYAQASRSVLIESEMPA